MIKSRKSNLLFYLGDSPEQFGLVSAHEPRRMTKPPLPCLVAGWKINPDRNDKLYRLAKPVVTHVTKAKIFCLSVSDCGKFIGIGCSDGSIEALSAQGLQLVTSLGGKDMIIFLLKFKVLVKFKFESIFNRFQERRSS